MSLADSQLAAAQSIMATMKTGTGIYSSNTGTARQIDVYCFYPDDDSTMQPGARHQSPCVHVTVLNNTLYGIASGQWTKGEKIFIPPRAGEDSRNMTLHRIVKQNHGLVTYEAK